MIIILSACLSNIFAQHKYHDHKRQEDSDKSRFYWQMPNRVIEEIGIEEGMVVADVGCGIGYFTLRIAGRIGPGGKVYASDIDNQALQKLKEKASNEKLENIKIIHGTKDNPRLPAGEIDLVLLVNVIHLIDDIEVFFTNITPCLKENSYLVIVQWDAEKMDFELSDWDADNRELFTMRSTLRKIYNANYEVFKLKTFLPMQNIYFCQPRDNKK
jgi:ubiquinone/menaquinone biosynthesis C-methylase UbiE